MIQSTLPHNTMAMGLRETDLVAQLCRQSFSHFVREFWDTVVPEDLVWNWHMDFLCNVLQLMAERVLAGLPKLYDLIVNISPGSTKSTICSVAFPAWFWCRDPSMRIICASYSHPLALELSRKSRDMVQSELYNACFPDVVLRMDQNTKGHFANTRGGMRYATSVGGTVTGMHGHFLIVDDPLDPQQAVSEAELKTTNSWMSETWPSRKVDKSITPQALIQQRLHQNDPTGNRLDKSAGKVRHISLPADSHEFPVIPKRLERYYTEDGLMDPVRLPRLVLEEARAELGEFGYAGQYGQTPVPLGGGNFKVDRLNFDVPSVDVPFVQKVRYWDKAGTSGGGAYTVGALMGKDKQGRFWVLDVVRGQWNSFERERIIRKVAEMDGRKVIVGVEQEPGSGGKESAENTARNLAGYRVRLHAVGQSDGNKELRADPYSTQVNAGNVYVFEDKEGPGYSISGAWRSKYIEELRYFPASTYKDQVDASSGAFNMLAAKKTSVGAI